MIDGGRFRCWPKMPNQRRGSGNLRSVPGNGARPRGIVEESLARFVLLLSNLAVLRATWGVTPRLRMALTHSRVS